MSAAGVRGPAANRLGVEVAIAVVRLDLLQSLSAVEERVTSMRYFKDAW
jgi:hypothetical protein